MLLSKVAGLPGIAWKLSNLSLSSTSKSLVNSVRCFSLVESSCSESWSLSPSVSLSSSASSTVSLPPAPKRSLNVFAMFVREQFRLMPADLPIKEKFVRAGQQWRAMSEEEKAAYKREMADNLVSYRQEMQTYLDSLSDEQLAEYKRLQKEKVKEKTRHRIKLKLRKLNYPKRNCSAYIFFIRDQLKSHYPDGQYPAVRTPEHIRQIGIWSQRWKSLTTAERRPYDELAESDRQRYFSELEAWKHELAKPENEAEFLQLERLSKKMETATRLASGKPEDELKIKKQRARAAAKVIRKRLLKRAQTEAKKAKSKAKKKASAKKSTSKGNKSTARSSKSQLGGDENQV